MSATAAARPRYIARLATSSDAELVQRFNARLAAGGVNYRYPRDFKLPGETEFRPDGYPVYRELMLLDDGAEMRAGVLLQHGTFFIEGKQRPFCWLQLPLSEGLISREHAPAFLGLMGESLRYSPFAASLGIGSMQESYARFLTGWKWKNNAVPFLFYPVRPREVLLRLEHVRQNRKLQRIGRIAAYTGAAWAGGVTLAAWRRLAGLARRVSTSVEPQFGPWADEVFEQNVGKYKATVRRDSAALNILYPPSEPQYIRLRVRRKGSQQELGWLLLLCTPMRNNKYFGDLTVGTLVTGFADPADVGALLQAGVNHLVKRGADIIVANWSHHAWMGASRWLGFLPAPSNFLFFVSPARVPLLHESCPLHEIHLTRGDCDSPSSLMASHADR